MVVQLCISESNKTITENATTSEFQMWLHFQWSFYC